MFRTLANVFRIPELRNKILFTVALLCVYRIGFYVPLPGVNAATASQASPGRGRQFRPRHPFQLPVRFFRRQSRPIHDLRPGHHAVHFRIDHSTVAGDRGADPGKAPQGRRTGDAEDQRVDALPHRGRCASFNLSMWLLHLSAPMAAIFSTPPRGRIPDGLFWIMGMCALTAGSLFLMWLGEQIDQFGIGNGVSLIITAGIISRMPYAFGLLITGSPFADIGANNTHQFGFLKALQMAFDVQNQGITRIRSSPFSSLSRHSFLSWRDRSCSPRPSRRIRHPAGQTDARPPRLRRHPNRICLLRVNHAGVMPIIFASSLMVLPSMLSEYADQLALHRKKRRVAPRLARNYHQHHQQRGARACTFMKSCTSR